MVMESLQSRSIFGSESSSSGRRPCRCSIVRMNCIYFCVELAGIYSYGSTNGTSTLLCLSRPKSKNTMNNNVNAIYFSQFTTIHSLHIRYECNWSSLLGTKRRCLLPGLCWHLSLIYTIFINQPSLPPLHRSRCHLVGLRIPCKCRTENWERKIQHI